MTAPRAGFTLVEALAVLLLTLLVLQSGWALTAGMGRAASELADRGESLAATRAVAWILQEELEGTLAGRDLSAPTSDSFALRAFRGSARVCAVAAQGDLVVRWSGVRAPDPVKDSVLVLGREGHWLPRALATRTRAPGACGAAGLAGVDEVWRLDVAVPDAVLLRFFERGSYHLADASFRYRIGAGGRQPLTPSALDSADSGLSTRAPGRLVVDAAGRGARLGRGGPVLRRVYTLPGRW